MSSDPTRDRTDERALVLGGGGAVGNAWLIGVVAGLADGGLDVTDADVVIGTSAGATAAAQLSAAAPADLYEAIQDSPVPSRRTGPPPGATQASYLERTDAVIAAARDVADMRRRMGALLDAGADTDASSRWRATVAARLAGAAWPERRLLVTAVDARSGEPVVLDRESGLDLVDAVAASTAGGFAYHVGDRAFIDGGYRAGADNADLAAGCARVLVLSPFGGRSRLPESWGLTLAHQVAGLESHGGRVEVLGPDAAALAAFGDSMLDLAARAPSAQAGFAHGRREARRLADFWQRP